MFNARAMVVTIGLVAFLLGLATGYTALAADPPEPENLPAAFVATGTGAVITLLGLWWPRR